MILGALPRQSKGLVFSNHQRTSTLWYTTDAYVDDTKLFVTLQNGDLETLASEMQSTFTTGGALRASKGADMSSRYIYEGFAPSMSTMVCITTKMPCMSKMAQFT